MGSKPSNNFQMDRPESGGADRDEEREKSGLLDRARYEFATAEARKATGKPSPRRSASPGASDSTGKRSPVVTKRKTRKNR